MKRAIAGASVALFLGMAAVPLSTGGSWDRVEGVVVLHQLAAGSVAADPDPTRIPLYGALWYRLVGSAGGPEQVLAAGRLLSLASILGLAGLGAWVLRRRFGVDRDGALLGGSAWLAWMPAVQFGAVDRCDAPALFLAASGWSLQLASRGRWIALGGMLAALSSLIRPTSGPEAFLWGCAALFSARREPRAWASWIAGSAGGALVAASATYGLVGEAALRNLLLAGRTPFRADQVVDLLLRIAPLSLPIAAMALWRGAPSPLRGVVPLVVGLAVLSLGRVGANLNWLLAASWFLSLLLGAGAKGLPQGLLGLLWIQTIFVQVPRWKDFLERASDSSARAGMLRHLDRPVLTSDALAALRADAVPALDDPHLLQGLSEAGVFERDLVLNRLRTGRWAVLTDPDMSDTASKFWSRNLVEWVRDSTRSCAGGGTVRLVVPREAPCPSSR